MSEHAISPDRGTCFDLGPADRIPLGEGRTFHLGARDVAVFRTRAGVFATDAACSHRQGRLADGLVGDGKVICPLHGYRFALATGLPIGHECAALVTYRTSLTTALHIEVFIDDSPSANWRGTS